MKKIFLTTILTFAIFSISFVDASQEINLQEVRQQREQITRLEKTISFLEAQILMRDDQESMMKILDNIKDRILKVKEKNNIRMIETTDDWVELTETFLEDPTLNNFQYFCERAKKVTGPRKKEVLDDDRTEIIMVGATLYENFPWCEIYFEDGGYIFVETNTDHQIKLLPSDTDKDRWKKIMYNEKIEELVQKHSFYVFHRTSSSIDSSNPSLHFEKCLLEPMRHVGLCSRFPENFRFPQESLLNMLKTDYDQQG